MPFSSLLKSFHLCIVRVRACTCVFTSAGACGGQRMQIPWNLSYSFCEAPSMGSGAEECVLLTTELSRHPPAPSRFEHIWFRWYERWVDIYIQSGPTLPLQVWSSLFCPVVLCLFKEQDYESYCVIFLFSTRYLLIIPLGYVQNVNSIFYRF